jgi:outer membrane protein assembly factor BamB
MRNEKLQHLLRFAQWTALTFILVLGGLMIHDARRQNQTLTTSRTLLKTLKSGDLDDPAIAKTVRDLDYLYRATHFQTQDRQSLGFLLLGIGLLVLCLLLVLDRYRFAPELKVPDDAGPTPEKVRKELLIYSIGGLSILTISLVGIRMTVFTSTSTATSISTMADAPVVIPAQPAIQKIILSKALEEASHHWPQFRGSVLPNQNLLPQTWRFKTKWQSTIPLNGFNSPVVWGDRIFVAGGDQTERAMFCFDASDGKQLWKTSCTSAPVYPDLTEDTGVSAPTLCVDKSRVYGIFATGEMICCDHGGNILWQKQLPTPDILYGYASSPLLLGDRLIVQYDLDATQSIYALDIFTGNEIWKTQREASASWSSPVAMVENDTAIIFTAGNYVAQGIDANTGIVLWENKELSGEVATSAIVHNGAFYFSNAGAITTAFNAHSGEMVFRNDNVPAPDVASPILVNDIFALFSSGGSVIGIHAQNGEELFEQNFDNGFYASPIVINGKIIAVNLDGELFLLSLGEKTLTMEAQYSIGEKVVSIPAMHRGNLIIRTAANRLLYLESLP